jgi:quercetin dioxygenase-like cupin family protein
MDGPRGRGRPVFLGGRVPRGFQIRRIVFPPGAERAYDEAEWKDAIVVVESGKLELECSGGSRRRVGRGDVLWLIGLPLRGLRNRGAVPAVLVAVSRLRTGRTEHFTRRR